MGMWGKTMEKKNQGFTLVELIVVLVILAILAAILVPALLGYIDSAKEKQDILDAKNCIIAAQAEFTEMYAIGGMEKIGQFKTPYAKNGDNDLTGTKYSNHILSTADVNPYMLILGLGNYTEYKDVNVHKAYTVYFAVYWETEDSKPLFFDGSEWTTKYPWKGDGKNTFKVRGEDIKMQFYFIKNPKKSTSDAWNTLKKAIGVNLK